MRKDPLPYSIDCSPFAHCCPDFGIVAFNSHNERSKCCIGPCSVISECSDEFRLELDIYYCFGNLPLAISFKKEVTINGHLDRSLSQIQRQSLQRIQVVHLGQKAGWLTVSSLTFSSEGIIPEVKGPDVEVPAVDAMEADAEALGPSSKQ